MAELTLGREELETRFIFKSSGHIGVKGSEEQRRGALRAIALGLLRSGSSVNIVVACPNEARELNALNINRLSAYGPLELQRALDHTLMRFESIRDYLESHQWPSLEVSKRFGGTDYGELYLIFDGEPSESLGDIALNGFSRGTHLAVGLAEEPAAHEAYELLLSPHEDGGFEFIQDGLNGIAHFDNPDPSRLRAILENR